MFLPFHDEIFQKISFKYFFKVLMLAEPVHTLALRKSIRKTRKNITIIEIPL